MEIHKMKKSYMERGGLTVLCVILTMVILSTTQLGCTTTEITKEIATHKVLQDGVERLEHTNELESVTQYSPKISAWGPVLVVVTFGYLAPVAPWYEGYTVSFASNETIVNPDGSIRHVEEENGRLNFSFKRALPLPQVNYFEMSRDALWDFFANQNETDFLSHSHDEQLSTSQAMYYSQAELVEGDLESDHEVALRNLSLMFSYFRIDKVDFDYIRTVSLPDGTIEEEIKKSYSVEYKNDGTVQDNSVANNLM